VSPGRAATRVLSVGLLTAAASILASAEPATQPLAQVNAALQAGEADHALALLQSLPPSDAITAEAHNLTCRVRFMLSQWDAAAKQCEQAVRLDELNSNDHLWLGRALGEKAARATFLSAFSLAKRVRAEFVESVRLDPRNVEALSDLGEFYLRAPAILGGGVDKARAIAVQLDKVDPARAHDMRGRIADAAKDYGTAEREYKQAVAAGAHPAFQWVALASFYRQRQQWTEMETALQNGLSAAERDQHAAVALYDGASVLTRAGRDPQLAAKMLEDYLASPAKTEEAPAFIAHDRLARLKEKLGDPAAANHERAEALALAHEYSPGEEAKH
jgi:tetratricopeptide (TPR) repeat protein